MSKEKEIEKLRNEIRDLRNTVSGLSQLVNKLTSEIQTDFEEKRESVRGSSYQIFSKDESALGHDISWIRLVNLLHDASIGLTAKELALQWGKSRSRTSEVLNTLVHEGHLTKYRDGREIKFRPIDE